MHPRLWACLLALALGACGESKAVEELVQCGAIDASSSRCTPDGGPTFVQVEPILVKSCVPCHDGNMMDVWPLIEYDDVAAWSSLIKDDIINCTMPPADAGIPITNAERSTIVQWLLCKAPR